MLAGAGDNTGAGGRTLGATFYGTSQLNGGKRRSTNAELAEIDAAIHEIAEAEQPVTIRGLFYRMVSRGLVPQTDRADKAAGIPSGYGIVNAKRSRCVAAAICPTAGSPMELGSRSDRERGRTPRPHWT